MSGIEALYTGMSAALARRHNRSITWRAGYNPW